MYEINGRVRYSEVGFEEKLTAAGLVNYFQDCSTFQSEDAGLGVASLLERHRAWVLSGWQIDIYKMPVLAQHIRVQTWPYDFKGFIGYRNYTARDENGELLAAANSIWTLIDTEKKCPVRICPEDIDGYEMEDKFEMEYMPRKIRTEGEAKKKDAVYIGRERIDTNGHMNNSQYIALAQEYVPLDMPVTRIRVEYKKEVRPGSRIIPVVYETGCACAVTFMAEDEKQQIHAIVEFENVSLDKIVS